MNTTVESFSFQGEKPGPTLVVLGAVHGNEICGPIALKRLKAELDKSEIALAAGRLLMVPVTNPGAYAAGKYFLERNLNRYLYPKPVAERKAYEDHLDDQVCAVLAQGDYLLDIHSYTAEGPPFAFISGADMTEKAFAEALGVTRNFLFGWQDAFRDTNAPALESQGTREYNRLQGGRGVTLECGQHLDPKSPDVAYAAVLNAMAHLGLIDAQTAARKTAGLSLPPLGKRKFARMKTLIRNTGTKLAHSFGHFDDIKKGEVLAIHDNGEKITASNDCYAIMPNPKAPAGEDLLYLAVEDEPV